LAGTGHDFLNRHVSIGCKNGLFIRTSLMKSMDFDDANEVVKLGPGLVFSEIQHAAS